MTKTEFLSQLRKELTGNINQQAVQENIDYYERYIMDEVKNGKNEETVLQMLGDPWVLAQTIIAVRNRMDENYDEEEKTYSYMGNSTTDKKEKNVWWRKLLRIFFVVMVIMCLIAIMTGIIRVLVPIFLPIAVVMIVVRLINVGKS